MLKVAIHGDDVFAGGVIESRSEGRSLAKVSAQLDYRYPTVNGRYLAEQMEGEIRTAIVNQTSSKLSEWASITPFRRS
jgi:hypothetical protein